MRKRLAKTLSWRIHLETTEDIINIDDLEFESLLVEAAANLTVFVSAFELDQIDLTNEFQTSVCPQSTERLYKCIDHKAQEEVDLFYQGSDKSFWPIIPTSHCWYL